MPLILNVIFEAGVHSQMTAIYPELFLRDRVTSDPGSTRDHTVSVFFNADASITPTNAWLLSESQTSAPLPSDPRFATTKPLSFTFSDIPDPVNGEGKTRIVYAWVRTESNEVHPSPMTYSVALGVRPTALIQEIGNRDLASTKVSVNIVANSETRDSDITGYLLSDTQTTQPAYNDSKFTSTCPRSIDVSPRSGNNRIYLWVKNRYFVSNESYSFDTLIQPMTTLTEKIRAGHFLLNRNDNFLYLDANGNPGIINGLQFEGSHPYPPGNPSGLHENNYNDITWHDNDPNSDTYNPQLEGGISYFLDIQSVPRGQIRTVSFLGTQWID